MLPCKKCKGRPVILFEIVPFWGELIQENIQTVAMCKKCVIRIPVSALIPRDIKGRLKTFSELFKALVENWNIHNTRKKAKKKAVKK
jgi:hypothetical protein